LLSGAIRLDLSVQSLLNINETVTYLSLAREKQGETVQINMVRTNNSLETFRKQIKY